MEAQTFVAKLSHLGDLSIQKKMKQCSFHILTVLATTCGVKKKNSGKLITHAPLPPDPNKKK